MRTSSPRRLRAARPGGLPGGGGGSALREQWDLTAPSHRASLSPRRPLPRGSLGWGRRAGGAKNPGTQVPRRSGGFVYKQWGAGSAAPPGGQCGPGEVRPRLPRPPQSGRGRGWTAGRGGHTPGARPLGAVTGAARGPWSLRLLRAGAAPQQQPVIGPALAWQAGRAHVAAAGWGGCDSGGGRLGPPWERACAGLWICRCLAWVCACVCLAPSLCWGLQGVVVSVQGSAGVAARWSVCVSPHVCLWGLLSLPAVPEGWVLCLCVGYLCVCVFSVRVVFVWFWG